MNFGAPGPHRGLSCMPSVTNPMMNMHMSFCRRSSGRLFIGLAVCLLAVLPKAKSHAQNSKTVTLQPKGNQLLFADTSFAVRPAQEVHLVFENTATGEAMKHNVVILNKAPEDQVFRTVGIAGQKAGADNEFVPQDHPAILAHTPLAQPGETVEVRFTAPDEPGQYGYLCTFTGHWVLMRGTMIVE